MNDPPLAAGCWVLGAGCWVPRGETKVARPASFSKLQMQMQMGKSAIDGPCSTIARKKDRPCRTVALSVARTVACLLASTLLRSA